MGHGDSSDVRTFIKRPFYSPGNLQTELRLPPVSSGKDRMRDTHVTMSWTEWLMGRDDDDSCWFDFMEAPPVWRTRWFWIAVAVTGISFTLIYRAGM